MLNAMTLMYSTQQDKYLPSLETLFASTQTDLNFIFVEAPARYTKK